MKGITVCDTDFGREIIPEEIMIEALEMNNGNPLMEVVTTYTTELTKDEEGNDIPIGTVVETPIYSGKGGRYVQDVMNYIARWKFYYE